MKNLSFENLKKEANTFKLPENDSYINSYQEFINYFKNIQEIKKHDLIIASHFVYGWMPTILTLNINDIEDVLKALNDVKSGRIIPEKELEKIKKCINNSMVGASKLLHFINPNLYAIWDSRVFRYSTGKNSTYGIEKPKTYIEYLKVLNEIINNKDFRKLHLRIEEKFNYKISPFRAIEVLIFETDKKRGRENKK